ncbi:TetR-like C-terminal domain-containing protein [Streptomyces sp. NPDC003035]|uniref:TetR-like C-terminal domain-containing protein n=1 Tax=Streptomyces sp. NPDC003035 TaxID=3364676 RepID=UPI003688BCB6
MSLSCADACGRRCTRSQPGFALRSVIHECDSETAERFHGLIVTAVIEPSTRPFQEVGQRGIQRGDVRADATDDLLSDVIPALMTCRSKMCASEWTDAEIAAMIDRIMMPLLRSPGA